MTSRKNSDEHYVIDLCDEVLGLKASRQQTFDFLRGDGNPGKKLPVDAYYPQLKLVVEYKERQHTESVAFFNKKTTVSGVCRDEQRRIYDQRRRDVLPKHGIKLIEISYTDFKYDNHKRLIRNRQADMAEIRRILSKTQNENQKVEHKNTDKQTKKDESVFDFNEGLSLIIMFFSLFVVSFIFHHYTTGVDEKLDKEKYKRKEVSSIYSSTNHNPVCCPQCGSHTIGLSDNGGFVCIDCGVQWYQTY